LEIVVAGFECRYGLIVSNFFVLSCCLKNGAS